MDSSKGKSHTSRHIGTFPSGSGTARADVRRSYAQYRLSRVSFSFSYEDTTNSFFLEGRSRFLQGYGVGLTYIYVQGLEGVFLFLNELTPISATISGEEIIYKQVRSSYQPHFESTGLGQVGQVRVKEGFDFSEGKNLEPSNDFDLEPGNTFFDSSFLFSKTGVANLGKIDFGLLISKGIPPDLQPNSLSTSAVIKEGHTYAVWSREGGVALLYVFDVETEIRFDWVYYPDGVPAADTAVQPISWGQLKNSLLRTK